MFNEGTVAWYACEIGKIQGRLQMSNEWAALNGGFEIIAKPHRDKLEAKIQELSEAMARLRETRKIARA